MKDYFNKILKILKIFIKNFTSSNISLLANNLTYVMLLTIFPFLAIILGISKGFGLDEKILIKIKELISSDETMLNYIIDVTNNLIDNAKGGLLTGFGIIILLISVISMLNLLENTFNNIWNIKNERKIFTRIVSYIAIIFISPILILLFIASSSLIIDIISKTFNYISLNTIIFIKLLNIILNIIFITMLFIIIPNRRVRLKPAIISSIITTIGLTILYRAYYMLQASLTQYNIIYGSIAFIPIFLIWMKYFWTIILIGVQITYSIQTSNEIVDNKIYISEYSKKRLSIYIFKILSTNFLKNLKPYTLTSISQETNISKNILDEILSNLCELGYVNEVIDENLNEVYFQVNKNPSIVSIEKMYYDFDGYDYEKDLEIIKNQNESQKENFNKILSELKIVNNKNIDEI